MRRRGRSEREEGDAHLHRRSVLTVKGVETFHRPVRRFERAARHVIVRLAGRERGLFADHSVAIDDADPPFAIGDPPVSAPERHGLVRSVLDPDVIDPEPLADLGPRLFGHVIDRDPHGDVVRDGGMGEEKFHRASE